QRVKEKAKDGNFIPDGAMWVEGDTNMAGGESLIRQFVYGKKWFREEFSVDSRVAWMPDTFGYTGALPQIMKGCGVEYFTTQKLLRADPECEPFPYNLFWWEGIDGSRILSHIFKEGNAVLSPAGMVQRWENDRNQKEEISGMLYPFGYGDGGGGPTEIMVEMLRRCNDLEGAPRTVMEGPEDYFRRASGQTVENVYYGELYLAWHRGTYTTQARVKKKVRQAEVALRQAEFLAGILRLEGKEMKGYEPERAGQSDAEFSGGCPKNIEGGSAEQRGVVQTKRSAEGEAGQEIPARLEELWKELLFCEFHDILPGTSIRRVNEEAEAALDAVRRESLALADEFLAELAGEGAVFNSLSWPRKYGEISIPPCGYVRIGKMEDSGECEQVSGGNCATYGSKDARAVAVISADASELIGRGEPEIYSMSENRGRTVTIENKYYRAKVDCLGRILSLRDKETGYEYAAGALNELCMYRDVNIGYDAWEIGRMYEQVPVEFGGEAMLKICWKPDGIHLGIYREEAHFTWQQEIVFLADSRKIEFRTKVDWRERHKLLKVAFPTTVHTSEAIEEIQFGYLKRPTHRSRRYERDL
ncbi:MAG: alpha-mannosidase, partial [Lachnospiraceae bacterium]|nr:alpha-mannosidase [Lachnospiraceae bacterium]